MSTDPAALPHVPTTPDGRVARPVLVTAIGIVDLAAAGVAGLIALLILFGSVVGLSRREPDAAAALAIGLAALAFACLHAAAGVGMLSMARWGRTAQIVASITGLFFVCLGTIVHALILAYVLQSSVKLAFSGRRVDEMTADERRSLAPAPPHAASSAPVVIIAIVVVLVAGVLFAGVLAAIAVPNLVNAIQRGKQKRTMSDMRTVAAAVESYAVDTNRYPDARTIDELAPALVPTYAKVLPRFDGWARPFDLSLRPDGYLIRSGGKDGAFETPDPWGYGQAGVPTRLLDDDIVFANGAFLRYPEGADAAE